jgi:hypothetical protein
VLYRVVEAHLDAFLDAAAHHAEGARLPMFVEQEFRDFLTCGVRMTESAARLVGHVLPRVPIRQWVLSLPYRLRYLLAWNHELCRAVLGVYANVHFPTLVLDGMFTEAEGETLRFQPAPPPTDEEIGVVLGTISTRVRRLLRRRGFDGDADIAPEDPVTEESPALAGISSASIQGRVALGRRAGARV